MRRVGVSLIEILIVIAILAILTGLVLTGIQKARMASVRASSSNNLRQIILGLHQLADREEGRIKGMAHQGIKPDGTWYKDSSVFYLILPWTYGERQFPIGGSDEQVQDFLSPRVPIYRSPADPSWDYMPTMAHARGKCSYVANMQVFNGAMTFPMSIPDGTTTTIGFAEHYYMCLTPGTVSVEYTSIFGSPPSSVGGRRATFADKGWSDVLPVTDPATKRTVASVPGRPSRSGPGSKRPITEFHKPRSPPVSLSPCSTAASAPCPRASTSPSSGSSSPPTAVKWPASFKPHPNTLHCSTRPVA